MEFISATEFLKQPKEVQEVFLNWWELEKGNLYCVDAGYIHGGELQDCKIKVIEESETLEKFFVCPLFAEGQLRQFVEEKINGKIEYKRYDWNGEIKIHLMDTVGYKILRTIRTKEVEVIKAFWEVALQIVREEIENGKNSIPNNKPLL